MASSAPTSPRVRARNSAMVSSIWARSARNAAASAPLIGVSSGLKSPLVQAVYVGDDAAQLLLGHIGDALGVNRLGERELLGPAACRRVEVGGDVEQRQRLAQRLLAAHRVKRSLGLDDVV